MSVTLDHIFSITIALIGGVIWLKWGYQKVFLLGAGIACVNFIAALFMKMPTIKKFDKSVVVISDKEIEPKSVIVGNAK
jgi:hypothetical protein